jgi:hypothetical protein
VNLKQAFLVLQKEPALNKICDFSFNFLFLFRWHSSYGYNFHFNFKVFFKKYVAKCQPNFHGNSKFNLELCMPQKRNLGNPITNVKWKLFILTFTLKNDVDFAFFITAKILFLIRWKDTWKLIEFPSMDRSWNFVKF